MELLPLKKLIEFTDKTAIVTGGAMGIGFGIVYCLAEAGANVVIADINDEIGNKAAEELIAKGWKAAFVKTNAASDEDVKGAVDALHPSSVGLAAYDASKHGLWGFTKNAALELAPHIIIGGSAVDIDIDDLKIYSKALRLSEIQQESSR